jgi:hypothetical protein
VRELSAATSGALPLDVHLRASGASMAQAPNTEHYTFAPRDCFFVSTLVQDSIHGRVTVEVTYDASLMPLVAQKRFVPPSGEGAEVRTYEMRTERVTLKVQNADGSVSFAALRGARPTAVIAPGRSALHPWMRRASLEPGEKVREHVLDMRERIEVLRDATLAREADRREERLGGVVRVYTIYGREVLFADDRDAIVGDMAGLAREGTAP